LIILKDMLTTDLLSFVYNRLATGPIPAPSVTGWMIAKRTTNQGLPYGVWEDIHFDEGFSHDGWERAGLGFKPIVSGRYAISIDFTVDNSTDFSSYTGITCYFKITINGVDIIESMRCDAPIGIRTQTFIHSQCIRQVNVGEIVYFKGYNNHGPTQNWLIGTKESTVADNVTANISIRRVE